MYDIIRLTEHPEYKERMANWFHEKWYVPVEAYLESMDEALQSNTGVPEWYVAMDGDKIIAGLGVIENDFHERKDLAPNICAVYTEEEYRKQGIAGELLNRIVGDLREKGVSPVYLLTDHTGFYERYGWDFFCHALGDGEEEPARLYIHR